MELISIIIGLAGFLFGIYAFYKNRAVKELTVIYANELIEGKHKPGVEMLYLGEPVSDFVRYEITLFNSGKGVLHPRDFREALAIGFENRQIVSQHITFASEGTEPTFRVNEQSVEVDFNALKRNQYIRFDVLTGAHSRELNPPVIEAELVQGKPLYLHQQAFDKEENYKKYQALVRHLGIIAAAFFAGLVMMLAASFTKYQALAAKGDTGLREQLDLILRVNSPLWFAVFVLALVLLIFAYESTKVLSPKFRRYKFEQLIQNKY